MTNRDYSSMISDDLLRELSVTNDPFGDAVAQPISNWRMLWVMIKALFSVMIKRLLGRK